MKFLKDNIFTVAFLTILAMVMYFTGMSDDEESIMRSQLLNSTFSEINALTGNELSQFCVRGAALIVNGRYEEAVQYEADFGSCMRDAVQTYLRR